MHCRLTLIACLCLLLLPPLCIAAQPSARVVVLPFEIHAQEDLAYLQAEIPSAIKRQLESEGAGVEVLSAATFDDWRRLGGGVEGFRTAGAQLGADHVIWGSLTWLGNNFSLDVSLLSTAGLEPPQAFSAQGSGIEELPAKLAELVRAMSRKIFRRVTVTDVRVEGNSRIETEAILRVVKTKPGDDYVPKNLSDDLRALYAMGYFEDIRVAVEPDGDGQAVVFEVKEKPTVKGIRISGNTWVYEDKDIEEVLTLRKGSILNVYTVRNDIRRIEELYKEKNFYNVKVDYKIIQQDNNLADVEYVIEEGQKSLIKEIQFVGNEAFSDRKLRGEMATSEKNLFSWFTTAGDLNQEKLSQDTAKLAAFYHNNGYIRARVGDPEIDFQADGIVITIKIEEGPRYRVGKVSFSGDLIRPAEEFEKRLKITDEKFYNREVLRKDVLALTDLYADEGYAYVNVVPKVDQNAETLTADINLEVQKGPLVYLERITISGNTKTRDKVIRRELKIYERELFSGGRLKHGVRDLYRLDYFEDVKVNTGKGSSENQMNVDVEVKEKSTGAFSFGAGFGNVENIMGVASISERNLFGRGQTLALKAQIGSKTQKWTLSFTEPWLFDIPLSAGADLYKWDYAYQDYDKDSVGFKLRANYPVFDYTRAYLSYVLDDARVSNVDDNAARSIKELTGENLKSSIIPELRYDSRDNVFNASRGSLHGIEGEYAGLGGDVGFVKVEAETGWYIPLFWETVGVLHAKGGYVTEIEHLILPDYEKFYLGGINSLRGFSRDDLAPRDSDGAPIGGDKYVQFNFEFKFPLVKEAGVSGLIFFDTGNIYRSGEDIDIKDLRESAGPELRWLSPVGPIRLAYGWILDPKDSDNSRGRWEFSMASVF